MADVVIFAVGSPLVVDYQESLYRAGHVIRAGIRNFDGPVFLEDEPILAIDQIRLELLQLAWVVPLFAPGHRQSAVREAEALGFGAPLTLVDPTAVVPSRLSLGRGTYINAGCTLGARSAFGAFVLINRGASIGHHADFGDFVSIGPGAVVAGQVSIGTGSVLGAGAVVLPTIRIGRNAVIGAGAVVTRDVEDESLVVGNPGRVAKRGIGGYKGVAVE